MISDDEIVEVCRDVCETVESALCDYKGDRVTVQDAMRRIVTHFRVVLMKTRKEKKNVLE